MVCHTDQEASLKGTKHGQAQESAVAGGGQRVRELPRPRPGARRRRRQGQHPEVRRDEAGRGQRDLPRVPQPRRARGLGRQRARARATCPARPATASTSPQSPEQQLVKATETQLCATCHRLQVTKTERAVAHMPVREGKMSCSLVPQPARVDQQRQEPEDRQLGRRVLHELSHRDARTDALRARAGARELRDLPRSARILQRPDARGPHADALPALSHREQAPGDALRQGPDHHQQEQPDVRHDRA